MAKARCCITLGGEEFELRFDMNAIAHFEDSVGQSAALLMQDQNNITKVSVLRALVLAGMQHDRKLSKGMDLRKVGKLMSPIMLDQAAYAETLNEVVRAFLGAFGIDPDAQPEEVPDETDPP